MKFVKIHSMPKLPGKWDGQKWVCPDQPKDTQKNYHYCCPSGWQAKSRSLGVSTSMTVRLKEAVCPEGKGVQACGPNPGGDVKCCPRTQQWLPSNLECPMPKASSGYDPAFMQSLRLPGRQPQVNLSKKLAMIGIPMFLVLVGFIVLIARSD